MQIKITKKNKLLILLNKGKSLLIMHDKYNMIY